MLHLSLNACQGAQGFAITHTLLSASSNARRGFKIKFVTLVFGQSERVQSPAKQTRRMSVESATLTLRLPILISYLFGTMKSLAR